MKRLTKAQKKWMYEFMVWQYSQIVNDTESVPGGGVEPPPPPPDDD